METFALFVSVNMYLYIFMYIFLLKCQCNVHVGASDIHAVYTYMYMLCAFQFSFSNNSPHSACCIVCLAPSSCFSCSDTSVRASIECCDITQSNYSLPLHVVGVRTLPALHGEFWAERVSGQAAHQPGVRDSVAGAVWHGGPTRERLPQDNPPSHLRQVSWSTLAHQETHQPRVFQVQNTCIHI